MNIFSIALRLFVLAPLLITSKATFAQSIDPAIGRLNYAGFKRRAHCTVTLIDSQTALSARHCVEDFPQDKLRIVLGYAKGNWIEVHRVKSITSMDKQDIAILCLRDRSKQKPISVARDADGQSVSSATMIGYPRSVPHLPRTQDCQLTAGSKRARLICPAEPGMSGSPVIQKINGERRVVGVVSKTNGVSTLVEKLTELPETNCS